VAEQVVNPSEDVPTEGLTTMGALFGQAQIVDEVQELPYTREEAEQAVAWVIRTNLKIEDMTDGVNPDGSVTHMSFEPGVRYKVPVGVARILYDRELLMELPYPFDERRLARR
jgi:hypothetical protein